ncbi:MAG: Rpn family recombination-promoting nuclease/putative transposase, partial [Spirochaetaceae bacterium]|nr:Rpn family recombination-promoting nuclease/putative transposase [Spirochaetaceae bacterium]
MNKTARPHAYSDMVFKFLLGRDESKTQLIAFINAVLSNGGHSNVTELDIQNPFSIKEFQRDKLSILDLKAKDETGRSFNLEVQSSGYQDFAYRSLYYWSKIYSSQIKEGEDYLELKPVISINLLNFILIKETSKYHNIFTLKEQDNPEITLGNHLLINYLEMPKLELRKKRNTLENWLIFFLYEGKEDGVSKSNQIIEEIISRDENIAKVHE